MEMPAHAQPQMYRRLLLTSKIKKAEIEAAWAIEPVTAKLYSTEEKMQSLQQDYKQTALKLADVEEKLSAASTGATLLSSPQLVSSPVTELKEQVFLRSDSCKTCTGKWQCGGRSGKRSRPLKFVHIPASEKPSNLSCKSAKKEGTNSGKNYKNNRRFHTRCHHCPTGCCHQSQQGNFCDCCQSSWAEVIW